ncbi:MAG TPA: histidine ammonia-lyase [Terriglobales bacterium]|nr:histidine ammonia-lyase [Terriglobales bacterium]
MKALHINGNDLALADVREVVYERRPVLLDPDARIAVQRARALVDDLVSGNRVAYAITTGVGKLSDVHIPPDQVRELQLNLIRSHSVGVGEPLPETVVRAMMLLRANSLAKGNSGVRTEVIDQLCEMLNRGVHPVIPSQGSVGASGDLAPLAHLASGLIGEGEVTFEGKRVSAAEALKKAGIKPLVPEAKEAISLINGTQAMLAVGSLALLSAETLADSADVISALSLDALKGTNVAFDERIHKARPHKGQIRVAANLRRMLEGDDAIRESHKNCGRVQDAYSLRCIPQVHGAVRDTLAHCREAFEIEMNSAVDNPLVFIRPKQVGAPQAAVTGPEGDIISGGNFHGEPVAFALDFLAIALTALAGISERRIERMVNPTLSEGLPPFLAPGAGLNSGFMMAQVTAAALVSENKVLAHPASVDSITTSGNKEDYVSMGMTAAIKLMKVIQNTRNVLAIEAIAAAQAIDFLAPLKSSPRCMKAHMAIRSVCPTMTHDRSLAPDFVRTSDLIATGKLAEALA